MNMSDRIGIMNRGRVEQVGAPTEIYERPTSTFIGRFLGEANLLEGELREVAGQDATMVLAGHVAFRATVPKRIAPATRVTLFVRPERVRILAADAGAGSSDAQMNVTTGRIRRRSFLGNVNRYVVEVAGAEMTVDVQNAGARSFEPREPVTLSWAVRDSLILEA